MKDDFNISPKVLDDLSFVIKECRGVTKGTLLPWFEVPDFVSEMKSLKLQGARRVGKTDIYNTMRKIVENADASVEANGGLPHSRATYRKALRRLEEDIGISGNVYVTPQSLRERTPKRVSVGVLKPDAKRIGIKELP